MKRIFVLLILLSFTACTKPPSTVVYYQLAAIANVEAKPALTDEIYLAPIQVAPYLNGSGLVVQQSAVAFAVSRQHLWVDALQQQLQRQLTEYWLKRFPEQRLLQQPVSGRSSIQLEIDRFYADASGMAQLSGHYRFSNADGEHIKAFQFRVPLTEDGYPAMVAALSEAWHQLLIELSSQF